MTLVFSCDICEICKKTYFKEHLLNIDYLSNLEDDMLVFHNYLFFQFNVIPKQVLKFHFKFCSVSGQFPQSKNASRLVFGFRLGLGLGLGGIFLGSNCPRTEINCIKIQTMTLLLNVFLYRFFVFYLL